MTCLKTCKRIILYEHPKGAKILATAAGWWDGIRGNLGPRGAARRSPGRPFDKIDADRSGS
jgi:hypothetical protein